jgi:hypothetical protein
VSFGPGLQASTNGKGPEVENPDLELPLTFPICAAHMPAVAISPIAMCWRHDGKLEQR